jgi:uncharacterized tellurite resistance protein B-like protein
MIFSDYITNHGKRVNKEYFIHLIQVSKVDGTISPEEMGILHKEGRKFGLTDHEIDDLINKESYNNYHPPYSLKEKFEHLYNIAEIILADEVVTEDEKRMIKRFAVEAGFRNIDVDQLMDIFYQGIKSNESEELLYTQFRETILKG